MAFEIKESYIKPMEAIEVGNTVRLSCKSDGHYEYCVWRYRNRVCNFEWKKSHGAVKKQTCTELDNRAIFRGDYNGHECAIDLTNVQLSDNGEWSCEMESYVWGIVRGYTHKKSLNLRVVKEITPEPATTPYVSHEQTEKNSTEVTYSSTCSSLVSPIHIEDTSREIDARDEKISKTTEASEIYKDDENATLVDKDTNSNKTSVVDKAPEELRQRNLPFSSGEEQPKPPVLAIVLTSLLFIFVAVVGIVIWIKYRKRKEEDVVELQWKRVSSNKEMYDDDDELAKQLRAKSETKAILEDISDGN
jgi:hypothetical protein